MKLIADYKSKTLSKEGNINLMFAVDPKYLSLTENLKSGQYALEISKPSRKRSLKQNAYLWALINEICQVEDGDISGREDLYLRLLEMSGAKYSIITLRKDAIDDFKKLVRHLKVLNETMYKGVPFCTVQVFYGSSIYDFKEMTALIDATLKYAAEVGIETDYWRELLNV